MSIRTSLTNLAQLLLLFVLFPIFSLICEAIAPNSSINGLIAFLGRIDLCDTIADILTQYVSGITSGDVAQITIWVFLKEFPAAIIYGLIVHLCICIFDFIWDPIKLKERSFKPLPILPGFIGIFLSSIITSLIGLTGNAFTAFLMEIGVIIITIFGIRLMFSALSMKKIFSLKKVLNWIIDGLYAVILSTYIATLMIIIEGQFADSKTAFGWCMIMAGITTLASIIVAVVRIPDRRS
jgi:hypothetical protein